MYMESSSSQNINENITGKNLLSFDDRTVLSGNNNKTNKTNILKTSTLHMKLYHLLLHQVSLETIGKTPTICKQFFMQ